MFGVPAFTPRQAPSNPPIRRQGPSVVGYRPSFHPVREVPSLGAGAMIYDTYGVPPVALHGSGFGSYSNRYWGVGSSGRPMLARKTYTLQGMALPAGLMEKMPLSPKGPA